MKIAYILPVNMKRFGYSMDNYLQTHFSVEISREVADKGHDVELHVFWDEDTTYTENNLKVYFYKTDFNTLFKRDFTDVSLRLLNKKFDKDVVIHFHEPLRLFFIPFMLKNKNITVTEHNGPGIFNPFPRYSLFHPIFTLSKRTILKHLLNTCRMHIVHNKQAMDSFSTHIKDKNSILFTANGINITKYKIYNKEETRKELGLGDETIILFAGRICKSKGIKELIKAFENVKEQHSNIRLVVAGPLQEERLKPLVEKYWIGFKNPQELQKWFTASDIFCLPTLGGEGFPIILIEALYYALPIITTDVPGIKEWLPDENVIFVNPKNIENLKSAICDLIDEKKWGKTNLEGKQFVLDSYTWAKVCQRYIEMYGVATQIR